jgi:hypothetical protein
MVLNLNLMASASHSYNFNRDPDAFCGLSVRADCARGIGNKGATMRIFLFIVLWVVFCLSVPLVLYLLFAGREYPLISLGVVISFVWGALLSAWITGLLSDDQPSQSAHRT